MASEQHIFYINNQFLPESEASINIADLGLLRGYGIFDFFRAVGGKVLFLEDHLDRFYFSATQFGLEIPYSRVELTHLIHQTIQQNNIPLLGIKLVLTGGYSTDGYTPTQPNFLIIAKPFSFLEKPNGMHLMSLEYQRELPEVKSLNYMVPIFHRKKMLEIGADDYIYHKNGWVSELSRSNIFMVKDNKIITPKTGILFGVTRKHLIKIAQKNWEVEEREISLNDTLLADELFTTGSTKKVTSITKIDGKIVGEGKTGQITKELQALFVKYESEFQ
jgi:branched-chain amino acid aminotransferase